MELKQISVKFVFDNWIVINRTHFGIETSVFSHNLLLRVQINRTHFGIETHVLLSFLEHHLQINRTHFGIETWVVSNLLLIPF